MGMAEDIAHMRFQLDQMGDTAELADRMEAIQYQLRYDIEPKLDKALEGKTTTEAYPQQSPDQRGLQIRYCLLYAFTDRKIDAIKALREATGLGLKEAKDVVEWIQITIDTVRREAIANKEAE